MRVARAGEHEDWDHDVLVLIGGPGDAEVYITPTAGKLQIVLVEPETGAKTYWNGTSFVSAETTLDTTITGNRSFYAFVIPESAAGKVLVFTGWVVKNNVATPKRVESVFVEDAKEYKLRY